METNKICVYSELGSLPSAELDKHRYVCDKIRTRQN